MKRFISLFFALVFVGFMASVLFAAPNEPKAQQVSQHLSGPQMSSTNYAMDWSAVGEISGGSSASANYKLTGTIGQMAANTSSTSSNYGLCTGFECVLNSLRLFLPLIQR
jgi:hypothetical protein